MPVLSRYPESARLNDPGLATWLKKAWLVELKDHRKFYGLMVRLKDEYFFNDANGHDPAQQQIMHRDFVGIYDALASISCVAMHRQRTHVWTHTIASNNEH